MDIKHISKLANLQLSKKEEQLFQKQLPEIISFISHLSEVDTSDIELEGSSNNLKNVYSEDVVKESLPVEDVVFNTTSKANNLFKVEMVLKNKRI
jgi:aspartyl-tRNA(Asn)/glutamyl-tRNA(Gln) amidotransferase subunit C